MLALVWICALASTSQSGREVRVSNILEFRKAVASAKAGDRILLAPGDYPGGTHISGIAGEPSKPILIASANPKSPARFIGGGNALQLSSVSWVTIRNLVLKGQTGNGLNIDDGGNYKAASQGVILENLSISELPAGNHDGIKLSGVRDFVVADCKIEKWGGSAVDMVGCSSGIVRKCEFRNGGDNAVQTKGGTRDVSIERCRFEEFGQRGVNVGGSTGMPYFRPPIEQIAPGKRFEAKNIWVQGCTFIGGGAAIAFVGVDGATIQYNTIYHPQRWALRILQETSSPDFVPCRAGQFKHNLIVFRSDRWASGGVNIGPGTKPDSFRFEANHWYCSDRPSSTRVSLPTSETNGTLGKDPMFVDAEKGDLRVRQGSPAQTVGAHAYKE